MIIIDFRFLHKIILKTQIQQKIQNHLNYNEIIKLIIFWILQNFSF